jgi:peptidoglycan hydrolase-like protein with peptidoglycan-binding domain
MKKYLFFIGFIVIATTVSTVVQASIFRTLRQGSIGNDVKELQILLNKDPETRIAVSGAGSIGHETNSFGALTKKAVIK